MVESRRWTRISCNGGVRSSSDSSSKPYSSSRGCVDDVRVSARSPLSSSVSSVYSSSTSTEVTVTLTGDDGILRGVFGASKSTSSFKLYSECLFEGFASSIAQCSSEFTTMLSCRWMCLGLSEDRACRLPLGPKYRGSSSLPSASSNPRDSRRVACPISRRRSGSGRVASEASLLRAVQAR